MAAALVIGTLGVSVLSLLLPWATTYDPWAWIVWGREVAHLDLQTVDGPSWKPLPVAFTTMFSLAGAVAPALWLVVARAGGLLAVAGAYAAGRRLAGPVAAVTAATALALSLPFARTVWLGDSEGLLVAALLFALERHLVGARRTALLLGAAAALLRPEVWPFFGLYAVWLGVREPDSRRVVAGSLIAVAALWFLPELWGSGQLWRSVSRAREPTSAAATFARDPAFEVMRRARVMLVGPVKAAALLAILFAVFRWRDVRRRTVIVLAAAAAVWLGIVVAMTVHGFSGNERYLMAPVAVMCVLAGVGFAEGALVVRRMAGSGRPLALAGAAATLLAVFAGSVPYLTETAQALGRQSAVLEYQAGLRLGIEHAVARLGGAGRVRACGTAATEDYSVPMLAWYLDEHIGTVALDAPRRGTVFQARSTPLAAPDPPMRGRVMRARFRSGPVRVFEHCGR